jgi:hypothetical protein
MAVNMKLYGTCHFLAFTTMVIIPLKGFILLAIAYCPISYPNLIAKTTQSTTMLDYISLKVN